MLGVEHLSPVVVATPQGLGLGWQALLGGVDPRPPPHEMKQVGSFVLFVYAPCVVAPAEASCPPSSDHLRVRAGSKYTHMVSLQA